MNVIKDILNNQVSKNSIMTNSKNINPSIKSRYYFESICLYLLANNQLNSEKNRIKPNLEYLHPIQLIEMASQELSDLLYEFETEQEINFERVFEEIGDLCGTLACLIAWVKKEKKGD